MHFGDSRSNEQAPAEEQLLAKDCQRKVVLLVALDLVPKCSMEDLETATGFKRRTLFSMIEALGSVGVHVNRINGRRYGYYKIVATGPYDLEGAKRVIESQYPSSFGRIKDVASKKVQTQISAGEQVTAEVHGEATNTQVA